MKTIVVHCKKDPYDIYIGRPSIFGNPFVVGKHGSHEECISKFKTYARDDVVILKSLSVLKGKILGCWCRPKHCHGDILAEMTDSICANCIRRFENCKQKFTVDKCDRKDEE